VKKILLTIGQKLYNKVVAYRDDNGLPTTLAAIRQILQEFFKNNP
jgi:hypothetical protein